MLQSVNNALMKALLVCVAAAIQCACSGGPDKATDSGSGAHDASKIVQDRNDTVASSMVVAGRKEYFDAFVKMRDEQRGQSPKSFDSELFGRLTSTSSSAEDREVAIESAILAATLVFESNSDSKRKANAEDLLLRALGTPESATDWRTCYARILLASCRQQKGDFKSALKVLHEADPLIRSGCRNIGKKATDFLAVAGVSDVTDMLPLFLLAKSGILIKAGYLDDAKPILEEITEKFPDTVQAKKAKRLLGSFDSWIRVRSLKDTGP